MRTLHSFPVAFATLCIALSVLTGTAGAQDPPMRWGKIPAEDLALTSYEPDTAAAAVVLADYGETVIHPTRWQVEFRQHTRIKILKESGYDLATVVIRYDKEFQRMGKIEGQTFVPDGQGKARKVKLDKKDIFTEEGEGDRRSVRFTLPALAPGAVIEYRYSWTADSPAIVPDWTFQAGEPVRWSEYRFDMPRTLAYAISRTGTRAVDVDESTPLLRPEGETTMRRWVMKDVPALRDEPFTTRIDDYRAAISFQLAEYLHPALGVQKVWGTWESLARDLLEHKDFGKQLNASGAVRSRVESLTGSMDDPMDRLVAIHTYVARSIDWNGMFGPIADRDLSEVMRTGSASVAETSLLLTAMLRAADIEAHPVLLSTRVTGRSRELYPIIDQFDYVLTQARVGNRTLFLDATNPYHPYDLLPVLAMNGRGWLVHPTDPKWLTIQSSGTNARSETVRAALNGDGSVHASIETVDRGYSAASIRRAAADADETQVVEDLVLNGLQDFTIEQVEIDDLDSLLEPVTTRTEIDVPSWAAEAGDLMYLNPVLTHVWKENPLKSPERFFPIDLGYPRANEYRLDIELPAGYEVDALPADVLFRPPKAAGVYERRTVADSTGVHMTVRVQLTRSIFERSDYDDLRAFYSRVAASQSEQIVLARRAER